MIGGRKSALIIGASGDIGFATSQHLNEKFNLTLQYNSSLPGLSESPNCILRKADVTKAIEVENLIEESVQHFGAPYALVYSAGIVIDKPIAFLETESWDKVINTNLSGAFYAIKAVSRAMMVKGEGRIILIGSIAAHRANLGQAAYAASKSGLEALSRSVAFELGRYGISCNVIAPGPVESKMFRNTKEKVVNAAIKFTPKKRLGFISDIIPMVDYLLDENNDFITGQSLVIDGGFSL